MTLRRGAGVVGLDRRQAPVRPRDEHGFDVPHSRLSRPAPEAAVYPSVVSPEPCLLDDARPQALPEDVSEQGAGDSHWAQAEQDLREGRAGIVDVKEVAPHVGHQRHVPVLRDERERVEVVVEDDGHAEQGHGRYGWPGEWQQHMPQHAERTRPSERAWSSRSDGSRWKDVQSTQVSKGMTSVG